MKGWAAKEASQNIGVSSTSRVAIRGKRRLLALRQTLPELNLRRGGMARGVQDRFFCFSE
jgi:hypothetical protein